MRKIEKKEMENIQGGYWWLIFLRTTNMNNLCKQSMGFLYEWDQDAQECVSSVPEYA